MGRGAGGGVAAVDVAALDVEYLTLKLEGLTKRDERALDSQLKRVMAHMLKQRHQPKRATLSWQDSIRGAREQIENILDQSPSLRRCLTALMARNYPRAVAQAAGRGVRFWRHPVTVTRSPG